MIEDLAAQHHAREAKEEGDALAVNSFYNLQREALRQLILEHATHGEAFRRHPYSTTSRSVPGFKIGYVRNEDEELWRSLSGRALPGGAKITVFLDTFYDDEGEPNLLSVLLSVDTSDWAPPAVPEVVEGS